MRNVPNVGDRKIHKVKITKNDVAAFNNRIVHEVCSTFTLAREIEWSTRLFVLDMKDDDEEGIGTRLEIEHKGPAFVGETLEIEAVVNSFDKNELLCSYKAYVGERLVAEGVTGQKILKKERISQIFNAVRRK